MQDPKYHRARSSMDVDRPFIDPTIIGIPQGWDDDYMVPVAGESSSHFRRPYPNLTPLRDRVKLAALTSRRRHEGSSDAMTKASTSHRRPSIPLIQADPSAPIAHLGHGDSSSPKSKRPEKRHTAGSKRKWGDGVYKVGYEREILDTEARLHETMSDLVGSHTFATFKTPPARVLDVGTGLGLWPISQSQLWPDTEFIGLDRVPCQLDINRLRNRMPMGNVSWVQADSLERLPFPDGCFDHVHLRFVALGVPEPKWHFLLEESCRILKSGGRLEIVETSYNMPSAPTSFQTSFASLLIANSIADIPSHAIDFVLPMLENVRPSTLQAVYRRKFDAPPGALQDATAAWITSALGYKTSFKFRGGTLGRARGQLGWGGETAPGVEQVDTISLWAWVVEKV